MVKMWMKTRDLARSDIPSLFLFLSSYDMRFSHGMGVLRWC